MSAQNRQADTGTDYGPGRARRQGRAAHLALRPPRDVPVLHYHSRIHAALGIVRGGARARFGADHGTEVEVAAGDVAVPMGAPPTCIFCGYRARSPASGASAFRAVEPAAGRLSPCQPGRSPLALRGLRPSRPARPRGRRSRVGPSPQQDQYGRPRPAGSKLCVQVRRAQTRGTLWRPTNSFFSPATASAPK